MVHTKPLCVYSKLHGFHNAADKVWQTIASYAYVGNPISSNNGLRSQKLLLKSECYNTLHVAMSVACSWLLYGVPITTWSYAIQICKQHCGSPWLTTFCLGIELLKDTYVSLESVLVVGDVVWIHNRPITAIITMTLTYFALNVLGC